MVTSGGDESFSSKFMAISRLGFAMKNICEICELTFPLNGRLPAIKESNAGLRLQGEISRR